MLVKKNQERELHSEKRRKLSKGSTRSMNEYDATEKHDSEDGHGEFILRTELVEISTAGFNDDYFK